MCDVKRTSGLALLVAGAMGSGDGLFLRYHALGLQGGRQARSWNPHHPCLLWALPPLPPQQFCSFVFFAGSEARLAQRAH